MKILYLFLTLCGGVAFAAQPPIPAPYVDVAGTGSTPTGVQLPVALSNFNPQSRCPSLTDDSSAGYSVGDAWLCGKQVYSAQSVAVGHAIWEAVATPLPLDNYTYIVSSAAISAAGTGYAVGDTLNATNGTVLTVASITGGGGTGPISTVNITTGGSWGCNNPTNPVSVTAITGSGTGASFTLTVPRFVAYGVAQLTSCYTTNKDFDLTLVANGSTTTQTIGFVAGFEDIQTANNFCSFSPLTCYVTKVYDQGGLGLDRTQATLANAPIWWPQNTINGFVPITFNGEASNGSVPVKHMDVPSSFVWQQTQITAVFAGLVTWNTAENPYIESLTNSFGISFDYQSQMAFRGSGLVCNSGTYYPSTPHVTIDTIASVSSWSTQQNSGYLAYCQNNNSQLNYNAGFPTTTFDGFAFGSIPSAGTNSGFQELGSIVGNMLITPQQIQPIQQSLYALFKIAPQYNVGIVQDGDSLASGANSTLGQSWFNLAMPQINFPVEGFLNAVYGSTCSGLITANSPAYPYKSTYREFIVISDAFTNDIRSFGDSAATAEACIQSYIAQVHALGPNAKAIYEVPPEQCDIYNNSTWFPVYQAVVTWLINSGTKPVSQGGAGADGIINFWSDPLIGPGNFTTTPAFCSSTWSADGQHPNNAAMPYFAPYVAQAVNKLLK